jgi:hypothetical protein
MRIAMWSGPRNISTAMMRSWGNRPDTVVCDEPLYAHYLRATGLPHPGADEVIRRHDSDWRTVVKWLTGPIPDGKAIFYQKHMTHHLLPEIDRGWLRALAHAFLIRDPREVLASYIKTIPNPTLADVGVAQQTEIFGLVREWTGRTPPVIDSRDVLEDPRRTLGALCEALGVPFLEAMLSWPPGPRDTDGVWAKHWYHNVEKSAGFEAYRPKSEPVPDAFRPMLDECMTHYQRLHSMRLR